MRKDRDDELGDEIMKEISETSKENLSPHNQQDMLHKKSKGKSTIIIHTKVNNKGSVISYIDNKAQVMLPDDTSSTHISDEGTV